MGEFRMPSLGADMERGTVVEWLVGPGDHVHRGDVVAVVDTDKATIEVEVFEDGEVEELLVAPGAEVPVGTALARIRSAAATASVPPAPAPTPPPAGPEPPVRAVTAPAPPDAAPAPQVPALVPAAGNGGVAATGPAPGIVVSPGVRHDAERLGVDLHRLRGSGAGGRILRADVERAAAARGGRVPSSPRARRLAARLGVDLASVAGTGPAGAVRGADVERLAAGLGATCPTAAPAAAPAERPAAPAGRAGVPAGRAGAPAESAGPPTPGRDRRAAMRAAIANLMSRSQREIPHYYLSTTVDLSAALDWLAASNRERPPDRRLLPAALLLKAAARAAAEVPGFNGFWIDGGYRAAPAVHLGVAVSLRGGGLVAPAIHDCDRLAVDEVMAALRDLVARSRKGALRASEMADPTITVTNLGDQGVEAVFGVIYPPQVALVGFGRTVERPWASGGMLGVRPVVTATLAADHRASDGHQGALLLATIDRLLQDPENL